MEASWGQWGWCCTTLLPRRREAPMGCPGAACLVLFHTPFTTHAPAELATAALNQEPMPWLGRA